MFTALSRIIPPPPYISMPAVGVDISDASLKYIGFKLNVHPGAHRILERWGEIAIPSGVVDRGSVLDQKQLVAVLKECKKASKAEYVRLSLPEERAYLFETKIKSHMSVREVRNLLEFRLEENVPIPSKEVLFDYTVLPSSVNARELSVSVVAYSKETIQAYHDACREAGLRPLSFEVEAQAMARAMVPSDMTGTVMIIDFGKTRTGIGIVNNKTLMYTSTVDIGGNDLSKSLRAVLGDRAEEELTAIKNDAGLLRGTESAEIRETLLTTVSIIKDEIATRMQYWNMRNGAEQRRVELIMLCGGSSNLNGLPEYLTESLDVPTLRGNVWENVLSLEETIPPIDRKHSYGYAAAVGLALRNKT